MGSPQKKIKLVIGLGNPDPKYKNTYHNMGARFAKYFENMRNAQLPLIPLRMFIMTSTAYVNESGRFVARELKKKNVHPTNLLIAHDDSDLLLGDYKLQFGRGSAGHKGVANVIAALGTNAFWRLRIGIRPSAERARAKAEKFVLKSISAAHKKILRGVFARAAEEIRGDC